MTDLNAIPVGTRVRVTFEGTVGTRRRPNGTLVKTVLAGRNRLFGPETLGEATEIVTLAPSWLPGDVITIAFANGTEAPRFTYVRGTAAAWTSPDRHAIADAEVDRRFSEGKVAHLVRGGKPVEETAKPSILHYAAPVAANDRNGVAVRVGDAVTFDGAGRTRYGSDTVATVTGITNERWLLLSDGRQRKGADVAKVTAPTVKDAEGSVLVVGDRVRFSGAMGGTDLAESRPVRDSSRALAPEGAVERIEGDVVYVRSTATRSLYARRAAHVRKIAPF